MSNIIIHLNEEAIKNQLGELVRSTVEETLNNLLTRKQTGLPMPNAMKG
jgi:citrate lyase gamma subunit